MTKKKQPTTRNCICCGKEIKEIDPIHDGKPESSMWHDAIVDKIAAGYGSKYDGCMFILAICDDCVEANMLVLDYVGDYMNNTKDQKTDQCPKCGCMIYAPWGKISHDVDKCEGIVKQEKPEA